MEYADIMQQVNNQFQALAKNLKLYKENQTEFISDAYENRLSMANTKAIDQAAYMYDKSTPFMIDNGNLIFNYEGENINYTDYKNPKTNLLQYIFASTCKRQVTLFPVS